MRPAALVDSHGIRAFYGTIHIARIDQERSAMATPKKGSSRKPAAAKQAAGRRAPSGAGQAQGLRQPVRPSAELAAIVGQAPLPRTEITKKLWDYIKAHGLQDARNKRQINADATLGPIFGGKTSISMFELAKLVSQHVQ
jgi:upstream activation factor subunit UAF30